MSRSMLSLACHFLVPPVYDYIGWEVGPFMSGWKDDYELMNWFDRMGRIIECGRNGGRNAPYGGGKL